MLYGDVHRFLLQSVASRGMLSVSDSKKMLRENIPDINEGKVEEMVKEINKKLDPLNQAIKIVFDEITSQPNLVFICTGYDAATKSQNMFRETQLKYFRSLLELIMNSKSGSINKIEALNAVKGSFTKTDAENMLTILCRMSYLEQSEFNFMLGIRAIHEFDSYFRKNMPDAIKECSNCSHLVFYGPACAVCEKSIHKRCLKLCADRLKKWPCCHKEFTETELISNFNCTQTQRTQRRQSNISEVSGDEVTAGPSDIDTPASTSRRYKRKRN